MNDSNNSYLSKSKKPQKTKAFFICILIASFLWLIHSLNAIYSYTIKVPVSFINLPQNQTPVIKIPEDLLIELKVSGLKLGLILLNQSKKQIEIDFNTLKSINKNQNYVLSASRINFNNLLLENNIKQINPDTLFFLEKTGYQKTVPVKVPLFIKCQEGYGSKKPVINPNFITIIGDTNQIKKVDTIFTQPLNLTNLNKSVSTNLKFILPNLNVYASLNEANISIEIGKLIEYTYRLNIINTSNNSKDKVGIFPSSVKIKFTSIQNSFEPKDSTLFKAMINSSKINQKTKKCLVYLSTLPGNVNILNIEPKEVEILILKK